MLSNKSGKSSSTDSLLVTFMCTGASLLGVGEGALGEMLTGQLREGLSAFCRPATFFLGPACVFCFFSLSPMSLLGFCLCPWACVWGGSRSFTELSLSLGLSL